MLKTFEGRERNIQFTILSSSSGDGIANTIKLEIEKKDSSIRLNHLSTNGSSWIKANSEEKIARSVITKLKLLVD